METRDPTFRTSVAIPYPRDGHKTSVFLPEDFSAAEQTERRTSGMPSGGRAAPGCLKRPPKGRRPVSRRPITAPSVLNEAAEYGSAFARGLRVDLPGGITQ